MSAQDAAKLLSTTVKSITNDESDYDSATD